MHYVISFAISNKMLLTLLPKLNVINCSSLARQPLNKNPLNWMLVISPSMVWIAIENIYTRYNVHVFMYLGKLDTFVLFILVAVEERPGIDPVIVYEQACRAVNVRPCRCVTDQLAYDTQSVTANNTCLKATDIKALAPSLNVSKVCVLTTGIFRSEQNINHNFA